MPLTFRAKQINADVLYNADQLFLPLSNSEREMKNDREMEDTGKGVLRPNGICFSYLKVGDSKTVIANYYVL